MTEILWHYMPKPLLMQAIQAGKLEVPLLKRESDEKHPSLWFTINNDLRIESEMLKGQGYLQIWDRSVPGELRLLPITRIGIAYEPSLLSWKEFTLITYEDLRKARKHAEAMFGTSNVEEWFASLHKVYKPDWIKVQRFESGEWIDMSETEI